MASAERLSILADGSRDATGFGNAARALPDQPGEADYPPREIGEKESAVDRDGSGYRSPPSQGRLKATADVLGTYRQQKYGWNQEP